MDLISEARTAFFLMSSAVTVFFPLRATALPVPSAATNAMKAMTRAGDRRFQPAEHAM